MTKASIVARNQEPILEDDVKTNKEDDQDDSDDDNLEEGDDEDIENDIDEGSKMLIFHACIAIFHDSVD